jgi:hypothetical protein
LVRSHAMKHIVRGLFLASAFAALAFVVCKKANQPPVIDQVVADSVVQVTDTAQLSCIAHDPDGDSLV